MRLNIDGLEDQWRDDSPDHPPCAICKKQIGNPEEDAIADLLDECCQPEVPLRIWREHPAVPTEKQEMAFHFACAQSRLVHQINDN